MRQVSSNPSTARGELSPDVARAEQCDAEGKHYEAINHLVAAAGRHDIEALTRLGKRLLIGDRAPHLPNDGARFLADASAHGGAEAAALLAVLYAVGASNHHGLGSGFESLVAAAERGWEPARAQLEVLAGGASAGDDGGATDAGAWRRLAASIDIAAWQNPLPGTNLCGSPLVRSFPDFLREEVCRWLIERARGRLSRALVYDPSIQKTRVHHVRTNTAAVFNLLDSDFVSVLVQTRMSACLEIPFRHFEPINVLHYDEGEEISEHFDFVDPDVPSYEQEIARKGERIVTFLVYLNDDYVGGETAFPELGVKHKGQRGEGLFFVNALSDGRPDLRTVHAGRPTRRGDKWIVSQFVRNRPVF